MDSTILYPFYRWLPDGYYFVIVLGLAIAYVGAVATTVISVVYVPGLLIVVGT